MVLSKNLEASKSQTSVITEEETTKTRSLRDQLSIRCREWCLATSIHGLPNIIRSQTYWRFFFWLVSLTICLVLCVLLVASNIRDYLDYSVVTKARTLPMAADERFPVVSFCNENPFISPADNEFLRDFFRHRQGLNVSTYDDVLAQLGPDRSESVYKEILYLMSLPDEHNLTTFGYDKDDIIAFFKLMDGTDPIGDLEKFIDPTYGPCFKFDPGSDDPKDGSAKKPRQFLTPLRFGIYTLIFLGVPNEVRDYLYQPPRRGVRIEVKDHDNYPFISNSVVVGPGLDSTIKLTKKHSKILPQPYSDCMDVTPDNTGSLPANIQEIVRGLARLGITYSREECTELLIQNDNIKRLGCYDLRMINYRTDVKPCRNVSELSYKDTQTVDNDDCPLECESSSYEMTISQNIFPSYQAYQELITTEVDYIEHLFGMNASQVTYEMVTSSFTFVELYFDDLTVMDLSETVKIDLVKLLSNLGGTIGIFLGVSVITAVECVELVLVLTFIVVKYFRTKRSINPN